MNRKILRELGEWETQVAITELINAGHKQFGGTGDAGAYILRGQPSLFDIPEKPQEKPLERRRKAMKKALDYAGEKFRTAFTDFVIRYLERHGAADGETIREAYQQTSNPKPHKWQACGAIYQKLRREGKVREVGRKISNQYGNSLPILALTRKAGTEIV